jgi:hypothetical protein
MALPDQGARSNKSSTAGARDAAMLPAAITAIHMRACMSFLPDLLFAVLNAPFH